MSNASCIGEAPEIAQFSWTLARLGLAPGCSRKDTERCYRALIRDIDPDVAGPNALAAELNRARDIIKEWKGCT